MTVLMTNAIGPCENATVTCAGQSAVWNEQGLLVGKMTEADEGLLFFEFKEGHSGL